MNKDQLSYRIIRLLMLTILVVIALFPFIWTLKIAFSKSSPYSIPPSFKLEFSLDGFKNAFAKEGFFLWIKNTLIVAFFTVFISIFLSLNAAYSLSRYKSKFNSIVESIILGSRMMPGAVLILPTFIMFNYLNLINSFFGLIIANILFSLPLSVWMLKGFIDGIPVELEEVAMCDGCSRLSAFYRVIVPLLLPGIVAVSIFVINIVWSEYFFARILVILDKSKWVFSLGLTAFEGQFDIDVNGLMSAVVIYLIFPVAMFRFTQKAFVKGATAGSVKG
jgi:ABC-type glycerol-3-phosphate transport system permease component